MTVETSVTPRACLDVMDDFGFSLVLLMRAYTGQVRTGMESAVPHGPRGYQILTTVVQGEQPNQVALAAHLGIDRTVMTYVLDDLVAAGLVERQLNPADRRQRKVVATPKGRRRLRELQAEVRGVEDDLLGTLDDAERAVFRQLLGKAARGVRDKTPTCAEDPC